ncbi:MAG: zinc ribbon domain-containing protein [Gammaproteobacteria bacterium]|nr:zinc ribbon domain-containing protein [Gammaproteobacteria bacterium]
MPIYAYACQKCNHTLDALQKISAAPLVDCPCCGEPGLKRLLSAPRFRLKGQGWYETDFKKDNQRNLAGDKEPTKDKTAADKAGGDKSSDKASDKSGNKAADKPKSAADTKAGTA